jgi:hypothetical protein
MRQNRNEKSQAPNIIELEIFKSTTRRLDLSQALLTDVRTNVETQ